MAADVIKSLAVEQLRTGTYVGTPATDSTGYIIIKDAGGTDRKVMIQASVYILYFFLIRLWQD